MPLSTIWVEPSGPVCGSEGSGDLVLSQPLTANLVAYRGDTGRFRVQVSEGLGGPLVDLTAATWDVDIRDSEDGVLLGNMTVALVPGNDEQVEVTLPAAVSEGLPATSVYDVQMTLDGDVHTLVRGTLTVNKDVSRVAGAGAAYDFVVSPTDPTATISLTDGVAQGFGTGTWIARVDDVSKPVSATTVGGAVNVEVDCTTVTVGAHTLSVTHSSGRVFTSTLLMESA